jgi:hypothetical protein
LQDYTIEESGGFVTIRGNTVIGGGPTGRKRYGGGSNGGGGSRGDGDSEAQ